MAPPKRKRRPPAATEESIVHALFDLANHLGRRGERMAARAGLTTQQWIVLLQISGDPNFPGATKKRTRGVMPSEIAAARGVSRPTVSAVVAALIGRGLVAPLTDDGDKRRRRLVTTTEGERLLQELAPLRRQANRRLLGCLDSGQREEFLRSLQSCLDALEQLPSAED